MFEKLQLETHGFCNRACPTCLRQTYPEIPSRLKQNDSLPLKVVKRLLLEAKEDLGFQGIVDFTGFDEPLADPRLPEFIKEANKLGFFTWVNTNGDYLDEDLASEIQNLDYIVISKFDDEEKEYFRNLLPNTEVVFYSEEHVTTHYSPNPDLKKLIKERVQQPCLDHSRLIIDCNGKMALCPEDIGQVFSLGNIWDSTLRELWFSKKHQNIVNTLKQAGRRLKYEYCKICPHPIT